MAFTDPRLFPTVLMVLDLCAAAHWGLYSDWRRCVYWIAAAVLTGAVTW